MIRVELFKLGVPETGCSAPQGILGLMSFCHLLSSLCTSGQPAGPDQLPSHNINLCVGAEDFEKS